MNKIVKAINILITRGPKEVIKKIQNRYQYINQSLLMNERYQKWFNQNFPNISELQKQKQLMQKFKYNPKISIITPVFDTPIPFLEACIKSVLNQSYENWELCIVDDASLNKEISNLLHYYSNKDKRIKVKYREINGNISLTTNDGIKISNGQFIAFLDHDDMLWPNALFEVINLLNNKSSTQFIYTDEDKLDEDGITHIDPFFKPDWSPDYLRSINYITHFTVIKKTLIDKVGAFNSSFDGAQDWDFYLRATNELEKQYECHPFNSNSPIQHIPKVLYSWRKSTQSTASEKYAINNKNYAYQNQKKVLEFDLKSKKYQGEIVPSPYLGLWNIKYKIEGKPLVSIIIPTIEHYELISNCLNSILENTNYSNYEIIIVDTGSKNKKILTLYESIKIRYLKTKILHWNKQFNFSSVCNFASQKSNGEYLVFLNNDTKILDKEWLEILLGYNQQPHTGSVGLKLVYPNNKIQHAGIVFNPKNKLGNLTLPDHSFKNYKDGNDYGICNSSIYGVKDFIAVTGACMMIKKSVFLKVSGFNEKYQIAFNDVDLGLKLNELNIYNISINWLKLVHLESITVKKPNQLTRDNVLFKSELKLLDSTWHSYISRDPFYNKNYYEVCL